MLMSLKDRITELFLESMTDELDAEVYSYFTCILDYDGMTHCLGEDKQPEAMERSVQAYELFTHLMNTFWS
jgi:methylmalonyl-CoA mutase N-terminal domain/subunit